MYKGRKETTHERIGEKKNIHQHKERDKYNVCL